MDQVHIKTALYNPASSSSTLHRHWPGGQNAQGGALSVGPLLSEVKLSHGAENRVVTTDGRTELIVLRLRVTYLVKVRLKWKIVQKTTDDDIGVILTDIVWLCLMSFKVYCSGFWKFSTKQKNSRTLTVDASMLPPNHTAYRCIWCEMTLTSMGLGFGWKNNFNYKNLIIHFFKIILNSWLLPWAFLRWAVRLFWASRRRSASRLAPSAAQSPLIEWKQLN